MNKVRCINLDWLEVFAVENTSGSFVPDADFFAKRGYKVESRNYGTPQYREMFTIYEGKSPFIEIRRNPYSLKREGGIFEKGACHIRLSNEACYWPNPVESVRKFLLLFGYDYRGISRVDLAYDFNVFDNGLLPKNFIARFMKAEISKLNQSNVAAHGKDRWAERSWNSLKWGSPTSAVTTKLYNKSLELREEKEKFYIRDAWERCGLEQNKSDVWRVEFSISSAIKILRKKSQNCEESEIKENLKSDIDLKNLNNYDSPAKIWFYWCVLANRYFDFRERELTENGTLRPKHRCTRLGLVKFNKIAEFYKADKKVMNSVPSRTDRMLAKRLVEMTRDENLHEHERNAARILIAHFNYVARMKLVPYREPQKEIEMQRPFNPFAHKPLSIDVIERLARDRIYFTDAGIQIRDESINIGFVPEQIVMARTAEIFETLYNDAEFNEINELNVSTAVQ